MSSDSIFNIGDKIVIINGLSYHGKYTGKTGTIERCSMLNSHRIGVRIDGVRNNASAYGLFWFTTAELALCREYYHKWVSCEYFEPPVESIYEAPKTALDIRSPSKALMGIDEFKIDNGGKLTMNFGNNIKKVIFNDPATVILWKDGTKTVVKVMDGVTYDPMVGMAMCICEKVFGSKANMHRVFDQWLPKEEDEHARNSYKSILDEICDLKQSYDVILNKFMKTTLAEDMEILSTIATDHPEKDTTDAPKPMTVREYVKKKYPEKVDAGAHLGGIFGCPGLYVCGMPHLGMTKCFPTERMCANCFTQTIPLGSRDARTGELIYND